MTLKGARFDDDRSIGAPRVQRPECLTVPAIVPMPDPEGTRNGDVGSGTAKGGHVQPRKLHPEYDAEHGEPGSAGYAPQDFATGRPGLALVGVCASVPVALLTVLVLLVSGRTLGETLVVAFGLQFATFVLTMVAGAWRAEQDAPSGVADAATDSIPAADLSEHPGTWRSYVGDPSDTMQPLRIGLAAPNTMQSRSIATHLAGLGHEAHLVSDIDALLAAVVDRPEDWDCIIADLDGAGDMEAAVDEMLIFRDSCPDIPVLLLSSEVSRDDFSRTRRAIGDATLRKPVFRYGLLRGLSAALKNARSLQILGAITRARQDSAYS